MIRLPQETGVICNRAAIRREVDVETPGKGRRSVIYDTHSDSLLDHLAALERMDRFYDQVHEITSNLSRSASFDRKLSKGEIAEIELAHVRPEACDPRTHVQPVVTVYAARKTSEFFMPARPIAGVTPQTLLDEARPIAEIEAERLYQRAKEAGEI
jgi:hypothetical protein